MPIEQTTSEPREQKLGLILLRLGLLNPRQLKEALSIQNRTQLRLGDIVVAQGWVKGPDLQRALVAQQGSGFKDRIGDILIKQGMITQSQLQEALRLEEQWGTRLGDTVLAKGWVKAQDFYRALADHTGFPYINLTTDPSDPALQDADDYEHYAELLVLPWNRIDDAVWLVTANPCPEVMDFARARFGNDVQFAMTSKFDIIWEIQRNANAHLNARAINRLMEQDPQHSAQKVFMPSQIWFCYVLVTLLVLAMCAAPLATLVLLNVIATLVILASFAMKAVLVWVSSEHSIDVKVTPEAYAALNDANLPVYTVLVPMYKEPEVLPILANALRHMDYPLGKLDIKLILEEDDAETIEVAKSLALESIFEILRVPASQPKTKPKALNYALNFARGEFLTIFDAEDKPFPDQLKMAVAAFQAAGPRTACIQARLNYFNTDENWLTRMFTLEYSLWFDYYLPALEALHIPIPLGGTSNHFRMSALREVMAWDPYNVTEDADLGIRLAQLGYGVGIVNSSTLEEANSKVYNWIRQRSRWVKGYMQTYLVHMRDPLALYRRQGSAGFWGLQFFIGGSIVAYLAAPVLWGIFLIWLLSRTPMFNFLFPAPILYMNLFNLVIGNGYFIYAAMISPFKRGLYHLTPYALTMPAYWFLLSIAGYRALWQLFVSPFYWEKTTHGISRYSAAQREQALYNHGNDR